MTPSDTTPQGAEPREDGWVEWTGGENPVPGQMVVCRYEDGSTDDREWPSEEIAWGAELDGTTHLSAYRVVSPAPAAPTNGGGEPVAWRAKLGEYPDWTLCSADPTGEPGWHSVEPLYAALQPQPTQQGGTEDQPWFRRLTEVHEGRSVAYAYDAFPHKEASFRGDLGKALAALNTSEARGETAQQRHARLKIEVEAWARAEGEAGRLVTNGQAPMWAEYEQAAKDCFK